MDSFIGLWLEVGPKESFWEDFMIGVFGAEIAAFGVGPAGSIPKHSTLAYPMLGIKGNASGLEFSACAARNVLDVNNSCYIKIEGLPRGVFVSPYPAESGEGSYYTESVIFA
jgi:hypothetical protein